MSDYSNYNTSLASMMSPVYNVSNAYTMNSGYGMGYGSNGTVSNGYMGGMMTPMTNVGVGQFNADYLIKDDANKNNYYTRPITTFKKQDDTGTILGIGAAALATIALAVAACKGKAGKAPVIPPKVKKPYIKPETRIIDASQSGNLPTVAPKYLNRETLPANAVDKIASKDAILKGLNQPAANSGNLPTVAPKYLNRETLPANAVDKIASKDGILKGLNQPTANNGNLPAIVTPQVTPNNNTLSGLKYVQQSNPDARLMFSAPLGNNGKQSIVNLLERNPQIKTSPINFNGQYAGVNIYATPLQQGSQSVQGVQQLANGTQTGQKLLTYTPANQTGKLNLGPVESYLPQANKGFTLPAQEAQGLLPSPQTVSTATTANNTRNAVLNIQRQGIAEGKGLRYNRHPQITGDVLRAEFGNIGLNIDTKAFAKLTNKEQRMINNLVMNGTPAELKAITCNPQYQHLFSVA